MSLSSDDFLFIKNSFSHLNYFIETGSYKGETSLLASKYFSHVCTIEIIESLIKPTIYSSDSKNISYFIGDSVKLLPDILSSYNSNCVFFIDAHQSGPDTGNNGNVLVPVIDELNIISKNIKEKNLFIINDLRFWKNQRLEAPDWSNVSIVNVLKIFLENDNLEILDFFEKNDKLWIHISHK